MSYSLPAVEEYERLLPVARALYDHTSRLSWEMLLPLFLLSVALSYSSDLGLTGSILVRLKRLVLVALLLVSFPMIAEFCQTFGVEVAKSIDNMTGIDEVLEAAAKRAEVYSFDLQGLLNLGSDLIMGALVLISFLILVVARFFLLAFQHFYWMLLVVLGPFMILGLLFESSVGITKGLFKNMLQISAWPIIWSILSAFLKALPFASAYAVEGGLVTIITLNLIIAIALLFSPFIVSQLCEGVDLSVGNTLRRGVMRTVAMTNPKAFAVAAASKARTASRRGMQLARNHIAKQTVERRTRR
ncbi:MAG: hypothetical protein H6626_12850 [Pseudobdellovibrionaceae bacterium]|nr:MAG: hypothetical protein H6626_12850 [Pseudobdellovibrionaceae bacterium]